MAESTKSTPAKSSRTTTDKSPEVPEQQRTETGADNPMTSTDGEPRPEEFGANPETFESATWAQTHGPNPVEETKLSDY